MKKFLATAALLAAGIGVSTAATATAAAAKPVTTTGKLGSFKYNAGTKVGKLTVGKYTYRVVAKTDCGYSTGQSGDQIRCKTLGKAKYRKKPVRIVWHRSASGSRVAELVAVDLS
jgi:hypothetical protein